ncbi:DUF2207 domain-containing protein [Petrocella sp. FN5]|uniref:DUF2207 domain-containing protein n=1 Tax=Petrocella sp. FN5 TaxID=3032002 RepID=UPI0023DC7881|nr:DUF2207 domain-containing protein [Petrocella sp. FN5]MDF1616616.1 DUF2207 domain-containing protein [Petrocella sp. FN5]
MIKKFFLTLFLLLIVGLIAIGIYENQQGILNANGRKSILKDLHYDVTIMKDGKAYVEEYRTYAFLQGDFSRGFLDVEGSIDQVAVYDGETPFIKMEGFDTNRPEGYFAVQPSGSGTRVEWYYRVDEKTTKTFKITYLIPEVATIYNDCVDYFHKYVSSNNVYKIKNLSVTVHLPEGANTDNTEIWAHGPSGGNLSFLDDRKVQLQMKNVPPGVFIEARFLMPVGVILGNHLRIDQNRYEVLRDMENKAAEESTRERRINGIINLLAMMVSGTIILLPVGTLIQYHSKLKRFKPTLSPTYYRDLPSNIYPAELDRLLHFYNGKENISNQISATLLDLIHKKAIFATITEEASTFGNKRDTVFTNQLTQWDALAPHEKILMAFIFITVGGGTGTVTLKGIKKYCSNKKSNSEAYDFYLDFESKVSSKLNSRDFIETKRNVLPKIITTYVLIYVILMILPMVLVSQVKALEDSPIYYISIASVIGFMITIIFGGKTKKLLTQKGENELALWQAFKKFLSDFTTFEQKELPELFMWEKYLVYATVLGVAGKLLKQLYAKYPELTNVDYDSRLLYLAYYNRGYNNFEGFNDIGKTMSEAMRDTVNIAQKAASKGGGGGFSSGGSDAGGGSGGSSGGVD